MHERRLVVIPQRRLVIPDRARQIIPVVGAALALTWGIGRALVHLQRRRQVNRRRQAAAHLLVYRRITIWRESPPRPE